MENPVTGESTHGSEKKFVPQGEFTRHDGKVAIVTGASANLGRVFAEQLAADGAKVVVHYNSASKADEAAVTVDAIMGRGGERAPQCR